MEICGVSDDENDERLDTTGVYSTYTIDIIGENLLRFMLHCWGSVLNKEDKES